MKKIARSPLIPVREEDRFDENVVKAYLIKHLNIPDGPMEVKQFGTGSSNLTYHIKIGEWEAVLRRPPHGPLPPKAHDMKRESELLSKIYPEFNLVPEPYIFCDDESILGVPFYVMEKKNGVILDQTLPPDAPSDIGKYISETVIDTLVKIHQIDYQKAGLENFGRPQGFLDRQVDSWIQRYLRTKVEDSPVFEKVSKWLMDHKPKSRYTSVIHNDYKINNTLLSPDLKQITAVFDWEMATVADPFVDLGVTLGYWIEKDDPDYLKEILPTVTMNEGFYTRREFLHRYSLKSGWDVEGMNYYLVFSYFKLAGVFQQIHQRYLKGQTTDKRFANLGYSAKKSLEFANELIENPLL